MLVIYQIHQIHLQEPIVIQTENPKKNIKDQDRERKEDQENKLFLKVM